MCSPDMLTGMPAAALSRHVQVQVQMQVQVQVLASSVVVGVVCQGSSG